MTFREQVTIKMNMRAKCASLGRVTPLLLLLCLPTAHAQETMPGDPTTMALSRKLSVGIAAGPMRFDTNFKFTNRDTGRSVFLDSEGSMDLPEVKAIPLIRFESGSRPSRGGGAPRSGQQRPPGGR